MGCRAVAERGLIVQAVSDLSGAYYNEKGLDIEAAVKYREVNKGSLEGFEGAQKITNEEFSRFPSMYWCLQQRKM